jgi:hypothetical protein
MTELEKVPFDMKLEVVLLGVSDVDRAKAFYENLGWRLDIDIAAGDFRGVQMTPTTRKPRSSSARESRRPSPARRTAWSSPSTTSTPPATT